MGKDYEQNKLLLQKLNRMLFIYTHDNPVTALNCFTKIIELSVYSQPTKDAQCFLSGFVSVLCKLHKTQYCLMQMLE